LERLKTLIFGFDRSGLGFNIRILQHYNQEIHHYWGGHFSENK
jgi:hypothetical protein